MIRTLLFLVLMYLLIKVISRLFLNSGSGSDPKNGKSFFYQTFRQFQQGQQQQRQQRNPTRDADRFEEIEEAEYEDITEDDTSSAKSSD
ncbi:hypothetical protein SAMN05443144_103226 [Fodinibius roseus]|uniref:DUF4834 domain-containing protein n=1 Tax=Fodinibius roseus TaxID=1194090 RepID=A0A1M4WIT0_9BACT|nr:hypothetical protein [Fodinibius roseus]SHE80882.1 hypothetical protein SAMN05443144_103226 [Fodinibius roseus]